MYRHHFVGSVAVSQSTNAAKLKEIWGLPTSRALQQDIVKKLAETPHQLFRAAKNAPAQGELVRPLLEDLVRQESYAEVWDRGRKSEAVIAVRLDDARARLWDTNLAKAFVSWKQGNTAEMTVSGSKGWQLKRKDAPQNLQFFRAGQWVVLGIGNDALTLTAGLLEKIAKTGRPLAPLTNDWLELTLDLPTLRDRFSLLANQVLPRAELTIRGGGETIRTGGRLIYPEPINWKHEPWKIPMKTATEPLISFTVARGIKPILKNSQAFRELGLKEVPNQFCLWGQQHDYSLTFLSVPVSNATNVITQLAPTLPRVAHKYMTNHHGDFLWVSNRAEIIWQGLPFVIPRIQPIHENGVDYVFASMFPKWPNTNPPPAELLQQFMNRTNVLYYDWEITPARVKHGNQLLQLYNIANDLRIPGTNLITQAWLQDVGPLLGNTVTELTLTGPQELSLVRRSHLGFTGFELAALMRWAENPGFPLHYERPPLLRGALMRSAATNVSRTKMPTGGTDIIRTNVPTRTNAPTPPKK